MGKTHAQQKKKLQVTKNYGKKGWKRSSWTFFVRLHFEKIQLEIMENDGYLLLSKSISKWRASAISIHFTCPFRRRKTCEASQFGMSLRQVIKLADFQVILRLKPWKSLAGSTFPTPQISPKKISGKKQVEGICGISQDIHLRESKSHHHLRSLQKTDWPSWAYDLSHQPKQCTTKSR